MDDEQGDRRLPDEMPPPDIELGAYYEGPEVYVEHLDMKIFPGAPGLARRYGSGENARFAFVPSLSHVFIVETENAVGFFVDIDDLAPGYDL